MNEKRKVILYLSIFFVCAFLLIGYGYYAESTKTFTFDEFSVEAPQMCEFEDISSKYNSTFMKTYRATNMDLTISIFDKNYIEDTYNLHTGDTVDFGKTSLEKLMDFHNPKVNKTSDNVTLFITNTRVNGQIDTDVGGVYNDDNHLIIVEGGDVELIEEISNSIKILNK